MRPIVNHATLQTSLRSNRGLCLDPDCPLVRGEPFPEAALSGKRVTCREKFDEQGLVGKGLAGEGHRSRGAEGQGRRAPRREGAVFTGLCGAGV